MKVNVALWSCLILAGCLNAVAARAAVNDAGVKVPWSYVGSTGPQHWGMLSPAFEVCDTGNMQSPVNIGRKKVRVPYNLKINYHPAPLFIGEDIPMDITIGANQIITNAGHAIQINFHGKKSIETITYGGNTYDLVQFHFHSPSENLWRQQSFPLEIHFVHQGKDGKAAVLAVFVRGGDGNPMLEQILSHLPKEKKKEIAVPGSSIDPSQLLPVDQRYYAFSGSLTSPPCSEGFQWIVMPTPITASPAQILQIRQETNGTNARPVQPLNGRVLSYAVQ